MIGLGQCKRGKLCCETLTRFPIPKTSLLEELKFRDRESVKSSDNNVDLAYLPVFCKSAVCICRTLGLGSVIRDYLDGDVSN